MVLYMTFDMYLFKVLPLLPWTYEFSKIMIIMYFGHRFPLTSHIRGHLLSTKMALLRPSTDIPHVGTQKENLDWSVQNTIDVHDLWSIIFKPALYIFILSFGILYYAYLMYIGLMNMFNYVINMILSILWFIYVWDIAWRIGSLQVKRSIPRSFGEYWSERRPILDQPS